MNKNITNERNAKIKYNKRQYFVKSKKKKKSEIICILEYN